MSVEQLLVASAQWLNDHATAVVLLLASLALVFELLPHTAAKSRRRRDAWAYTRRVNIALLACALAISGRLHLAFTRVQQGTGRTVRFYSTRWAYLQFHICCTSAGVLLLDLLMYVIHRAMHSVPLLWRFHQVHHSDETHERRHHFRQHPGQMLVVTLVQLPALWLLGIPAASWVFYVVIRTALQLWQHSTCSATESIERLVNGFVVTAMHRVHHDASAVS